MNWSFPSFETNWNIISSLFEILNQNRQKEQNIAIPDCGRERCGEILSHAQQILLHPLKTNICMFILNHWKIKLISVSVNRNGCTQIFCWLLGLPWSPVTTCYHNCTTFTKPIQLYKKKNFFSAFYVSILSTNEKSSHRAAAGRKWKNKFRKSVRAVVFNPTLHI